MKNPGPNPVELLRSLALDTPMSRQPFSVIPEMLWPALYADNFEGQYNWKPMPTYCTGSDYVQETATRAALVGTQALTLKTKSTSPTALDCVAVYRHACMAPSNFIRYQGALNFPTEGDSGYFSFWMFFLDGALRYKSGMRFWTNGRADYHGDDTYDHQVPALKVVTTPNSWNKFDFMVDVHAHKYVYVALNAVRVALTQPILQYGDWDDTSLALDLVLWTNQDARIEAYIDQLLVTPHPAAPIL